MGDTWLLAVSVLGLAFLGAGTWWAWLNDITKWNQGRCFKCARPLENFDTDSQGGRGYVCRACNRYLWISYPVDT